MLRYIPAFFLLTAGVYATTCNPDQIPTVSLFVNGQEYTGTGIVVTPSRVSCTHTISGTATDILQTGGAYSVTFNSGFVAEDPLVDFGLEFSSFDDGGGATLQALQTLPGSGLQTPAINLVTDLTIELIIRSNYSGGPFDFLNIFSFGELIDNGSDGAFLFGNQLFFLDGNQSPAAVLNFNCPEAGGCNGVPPPTEFPGPALVAGPLSIGGETGIMELRLNFALSAGDTFVVGGGTALEATPEPATLSLIGIGLLSLVAIARSRRQKV